MDKKGIKRFIENKYNNVKIDYEEETKKIHDKYNTILAKHIEVYPPSTMFKIKSNNKKSQDYSLYTGSGGNTYLYWRIYLLNKNSLGSNSDLQIKALNYFKDAITSNCNLVKEDDSLEHYDPPPSFFMGPAGIFTMSCIYAVETKDEKMFNQNLKNLLSLKSICFSKSTEYEVLYGVAGYLYSLLLVSKICKTQFTTFNLDLIIFDITKELFKVGINFKKEYSTNCLVYPWPKNKVKNKKDIYLGAAHGVFGCLYMFIKSLTYLKNYKDDLILKISKEVKSSLDFLITIQYESGNFPSDYGNFKDDNKLHFCHGATGAVYLFTAAYEFYQDETYLKVALKAGEDIWKRGILMKGNCVCHGIVGNAYALFNLYKNTKDIEWRRRGYCFVNATFDDEIQKECRNLDDPQRLVQGIPDTPYSLMEGNGGLLCLLSDVVNSENLVFPGFEL